MRPEHRTVALSDLRASGSATGGKRISGTAIVYNALSSDLGGFRERFLPGAARLAVDLPVLFNHDTAWVLGRTSSGTARVRDDGQGIAFEVDAPDTQWARDLAVSMARGDISKCSFAFLVVGDRFYYDDVLGTVVREVTEAEIIELSIVTLPAYVDTNAVCST